MQGNRATSPSKSLEARQLADWVEKLDLENQVLRECISRCADTLLSDPAAEDRNSAAVRRKGLAVLLESGQAGPDTSKARLYAKQLLQSQVLKSSHGPSSTGRAAALPAAELERELERSSLALDEQLRQQKSRLASLDVEVDALQHDLAATQERQQTLENAALEERLRHDALSLGSSDALQFIL